MITTTRPRRIAASIIAAMALMTTGLAAAPAQAAATLVTIHVTTGTAHTPVTGLTLTGFKPTDVFSGADFFESEDTPGEYTTTGLRSGLWTIAADDLTNAEQPYATAFKDIVVTASQNNAVDIEVHLGAVISGTVKAPSGKGLNAVVVVTDNNGTDFPLDGGDITVKDGSFHARGLEEGDYTIHIGFDGRDPFNAPVTGPSLHVNAGEIAAPLNIKGIRVPNTFAVSGKSTTRKKATLSVRASGKPYGITNPGGTVTVKEGSKVRASHVAVRSGVATVTLTGLSKGRHTFTVSYVGGDLQNATRKVTVTVK